MGSTVTGTLRGRTCSRRVRDREVARPPGQCTRTFWPQSADGLRFLRQPRQPNGREAHFPTADLPNASIPGLFWRSENTIVARAGPCTRSAEREEIIEILVARHGIADRRLLSDR